MGNRVTVISIIVEDPEMAASVNSILHDFGTYIIGRLGIPYREKKISVICIVLDAPGEISSALSGKLGMLPGVSCRSITSKI